MSISRVLREKLMDAADDDQKPAAGGPAPGETQEAYDLKIAAAKDRGDVVDDKVDDKTDDKKAADEKAVADKKAADDKAADDKTDDKKDDKKDDKVSIPKFRYDAAAARARKAEEKAAAAEARIQELLGQKAPQGATTQPGDEPLTVDQAEDRILAIDDELETAVEADDAKKMLQLMREQRELRDGIYSVQLDQAVKTGSTSAVNDVQLERVITEIETQIPVLDPNSETYSDALAVETLELAEAIELKGNTPAEAMLQAVDYMSSKLGEGAADVVKDAKTEPKKTDLERNKKVADTTTDLPGAKGGSDSDKAGLAADKPNIAVMSDGEFNTMMDEAPEEHARLRGDFV